MILKGTLTPSQDRCFHRKELSYGRDQRHHQISYIFLRLLCLGGEPFPDGKKEIAFIGRSNVGKSSLINSLTGRKKLAYVSREPGKTRTINYYAIQSRRIENEEEQRQDWYLVDLPGYGFAKTSQENKDSWSSFIDEYMKKSPGLIMIGLLLDLRHPGLPIDLKAFDWLKKAGVPIQIIATKGDKLSRNDLKKNLMQMKKLFPTASLPLAYSSLTGEGRDALLEVIERKICE